MAVGMTMETRRGIRPSSPPPGRLSSASRPVKSHSTASVPACRLGSQQDAGRLVGYVLAMRTSSRPYGNADSGRGGDSTDAMGIAELSTTQELSRGLY